MNRFSRRDVIWKLGSVAAVGALPGAGFAQSKNARSKRAHPISKERSMRAHPISNDFYVIFSGAWLFSIETNNVVAITTDWMEHDYQYGDSSGDTVTLSDIPADANYSIQVKGSSLPLHKRDLVQKMIDKNQGVFFNNQVQLASSLPSGLRKVSLSMPSAIEPAALFRAQRGNPLVSVDATNTLGKVTDIPGAVVFIYSGWTSASFDTGTQTSFDPSSGGIHLMMRVCPSATCDYPIPCDQNYADAVTQQEEHAINVFGDLLGLLSFQRGHKPALSFPTCIVHDTGIAVNRGSDGTLNLDEIGMFTDSCGGKIGTLHTCAAAGLFVGA